MIACFYISMIQPLFINITDFIRVSGASLRCR